MRQLEINFDDTKDYTYDDVMNMFVKLALKKQRNLLFSFFDHDEKEDKFFNKVELSKYMGDVYNDSYVDSIHCLTEVNSLNNKLCKYMISRDDCFDSYTLGF